MTDSSESTPSGKKNVLTIGLLVIILMMFAYAVFGERGVLRILQAQEQKQDLEQSLEQLRQEQAQLQLKIERLQKDKNYWEELARTNLGMVREGELIYHIPDQNSSREKVEE